MPKNVLKISALLPAIPDWIKSNTSITLPLPGKKAKELANKLLEIQGDIEIELNFAAGKEPSVEIKYEANEPKK